MKTLINFIICSITLSLITLFFYLRFTNKRPIIDLNVETLAEYYTAIVILFIVSFSLFIFLVISYIIKQIMKNKPYDESSYAIKFVFWYQKINIFYKTYTIIFDYLSPKYTQHLVTLAKHFSNWSKKTYLILIYIFCVLPRSLILVILLLETYKQQLHYYFYSLLLLLIPLIFKFFVFILKDIGPRVLPELNKLLVWNHSTNNTYTLNTPEGEKRLNTINVKFTSEYADRDLDHYMYNYYYPMLYIEGEMSENFIPKYSKITLIMLFIYLGVHICVWGYLLWLAII